MKYVIACSCAALALVGCTPRVTSPFVNEHSFVKACKSPSHVGELLGTPAKQTYGEVVQYVPSTGTQVMYCIVETQEFGEYMQVYESDQFNEQIKLLFAGENQRLVAAEYCIDNVPVYHFGKRGSVRSLPTMSSQASVVDRSFRSDPAIEARKQSLIEFFKNSLEQDLAGALAKQQADTEASIADEEKFNAEKLAAEQAAAEQAATEKAAAEKIAKDALEKENALKAIAGNNKQESGAAIGGDEKKPPLEPGAMDRNWTLNLPKGVKLSKSITEMPKNWTDASYPDNGVVKTANFPDGSLSLVLSFKGPKLHGTAASMYRNGGLATLANYKDNRLTGQFRLWDENRTMVLYSEYLEGKRHGITLFFEGEYPALVQMWADGKLLGERLIERKEDQLTLVKDDENAGPTHTKIYTVRKKLDTLNAEISKNERNLKDDVRESNVKINAAVAKSRPKPRKSRPSLVLQIPSGPTWRRTLGSGYSGYSPTHVHFPTHIHR